MFDRRAKHTWYKDGQAKDRTALGREHENTNHYSNVCSNNKERAADKQTQRTGFGITGFRMKYQEAGCVKLGKLFSTDLQGVSQ